MKRSIKLSRLTDSQLKYLLRHGEVRFGDYKTDSEIQKKFNKDWISKAIKQSFELFNTYANIKSQLIEGAGSRFDKENPLRYSPEAKAFWDSLWKVQSSVRELKNAAGSMKKFL